MISYSFPKSIVVFNVMDEVDGEAGRGRQHRVLVALCVDRPVTLGINEAFREQKSMLQHRMKSGKGLKMPSLLHGTILIQRYTQSGKQ